MPVNHHMNLSRQSLRFWIVTLAALLTTAVTASLGVWQLNRAAQKLALKAEMDARALQAPWGQSDLLAAANPGDGVYRVVTLRGRWVQGHDVYLENRQMDGRVGFFVVTPLRLSGSERAVLVQRGWVPRDFNDRQKVPPIESPTEETEIVGRLAPPPARLYEFAESPPGPIRQNIDLAAYARETGLNLLPVSVQQTGPDSDGLMRRWPAPAVDVSKHHGYAFQWFALCALVASLYLWFQIFLPRRKRNSHGPDAR